MHTTSPVESSVTDQSSAQRFFQRKLGWWLLLFLPLAAAAVHFLHLLSVDREWMYAAGFPPSLPLSPAFRAELVGKMVSASLGFQFLKQAFWPILLLLVETLMLAALTVAVAQLFNVGTKIRHFFLLALWSKATYLLTVSIILVRLLLQDFPTRIMTHDLDILSWQSLLGSPHPDYLQFFTSYHGPMVFVSIGVLAYGFRQLTGRSWLQSIVFGVIPYAIVSGVLFYIFARVF